MGKCKARVIGCGDAKCDHETADRDCPSCKKGKLILVKSTGVLFCNSYEACCDYEELSNNVVSIDKHKERIEDNQPHLSIQDSKGDMHVVPVQVIKDLDSGKVSLDDCPDMKPVLIALAYDWVNRMT